MDINQVWPEWQEECVLGEGSFGKVYRAKRIEYGRTFYSAIKVLTVPKNQQEIKQARSLGMDDNAIYAYFQSLVDNLLNEITLMDNLKGAKNIVGIEDYKIIEHEGELGWDIFIRMELLTPFDSFISNPEFSQRDVIKLGMDICSALEVCEQNNIVHRDIKPDNIFISRFGEYKLGDFGIARKLEATQANLSRKGTLNYMAPEVYKSEQYGSNVDIYSLGLVLYTLLNNNRCAFLPAYPQPVSYSDNENALSKRLSGEPLPPPCNASPTLAAAILRACAYRPQDRYQSATELKNALIAEWNVLVQLGINQGINSEAVFFDNGIAEKMQRTTNDMTANGRLVVEEYSQGTTVLDSASDTQQGYNYTNQQSVQAQVYNEVSPQADISLPVTYENTKKIKACRAMSKIFAIILAVLGVVSLSVCDVEGYYMLALAFMALLSSTNKVSMAIVTFAVGVSYIIEPVVDAMNYGFNSITVETIVGTLSGALVLFGSIVILTQKEISFGGTLCVSSVVIQWLVNVYMLINGDIDLYNIEISLIGLNVAMLVILLWTAGYRRAEKPDGIKKIFHFVSYAGIVLSGIGIANKIIDTFM